MSMTPRQIQLVQSTFRMVQPLGTMAAELFYKHLFEIEPTATALFKGDMKQLGREFIQVLAIAVGGLSHTPTLVPLIQRLGLQHASHGVQAQHYDSVRQALLWMLVLILQDEFTEEVRAAWSTAYAMLAGIMKEAACDKP